MRPLGQGKFIFKENTLQVQKGGRGVGQEVLQRVGRDENLGGGVALGKEER